MSEGRGFERLIGVRALALTGINTTVGAGIFGLPALVAADMGSSAPIAYILTALLFFAIVLCFAEAGTRVSGAGGLYAYSRTAFGPFAGSFVGTLLWFANGALSNAAVAVLMVNGLALAFPALGQPFGRSVTLIVVYVVLAVINIRGAQARASCHRGHHRHQAAAADPAGGGGTGHAQLVADTGSTVARARTTRARRGAAHLHVHGHRDRAFSQCRNS